MRCLPTRARTASPAIHCASLPAAYAKFGAVEVRLRQRRRVVEVANVLVVEVVSLLSALRIEMMRMLVSDSTRTTSTTSDSSKTNADHAVRHIHDGRPSNQTIGASKTRTCIYEIKAVLGDICQGLCLVPDEIRKCSIHIKCILSGPKTISSWWQKQREIHATGI